MTGTLFKSRHRKAVNRKAVNGWVSGGVWLLLGASLSAAVMADDQLRINGFMTAGVTGMDAQTMPPCPTNKTVTLGTQVVSGLMNVTPQCSTVSRSVVNPGPIEYTPYYDHIQSVPSWTNSSILGLQADYTIDEKSSVTAQLVSYGVQNFEVEDIWAYGTYKVNDNLQLRLGRQRLPFYMLSEQLDVGMSYPWARPPLDLYSVPVNTYNGLSGRWQWQAGSLSGDIDALFGQAPATSNSPYVPLGFDLKDVRGLVFNMYVGDFSFRASYIQLNVLINVQDDQSPGQKFLNLDHLLQAVGVPGIDHEEADYSDVGMNYDNGSLLVMTEVGDLHYSQGIFQDPFRGYVLVGYHMGSFLPNFTISKARTNTSGNIRRSQAIGAINNPANLSKIAALAGVNPSPTQLATAINSSYFAQENIANDGMQETTYTLGVRYDITPKISAKLEWSRIQGFGSGYGGLNGSFFNTSGWGMFSDAPVGGKVNMYTFVVNAMF